MDFIAPTLLPQPLERRPFALHAADYALPAHIRLSIAASTGSTNSDLLALARSDGLRGADSGQVTVRIAHDQTAGRGRQGRAWHASGGTSLLMSAACVRKESVQQLGAITLAFGIAAAQALRDHAVHAQLKWPNDVLLNGAKLAGILVESVSTRGGIAIVAGIGINGVMDAQARAACGQPVAALEDAVDLTPECAARIGRSVACAFADVLRAPHLAPLSDVQAHFAQFDALRDHEVVLFANGTQVGAGCALGVDGEGHLLVREGTAVRRYVSGEVSLRAA